MIRNLPFNNIPGRIIIEMIRFLGIYINQEPSENGVSDVYYPQNIIMAQDLDIDKNCKLIFGSYVEAYEYFQITNDMEGQTVSFICLGPTKNFQGSYKTSSLKTGRVVTHKQKIRELPIPTWFTHHVEALDVRVGQDLANGNEPTFVNRFANNNDFAADPHEGGIAVVAQDDNEQDNNKDDGDSNTDEELDDPSEIALDTT